MSFSVTDRRQGGIVAVALLLGVWALLGLTDLPHRPYAGFRRDAAGVVTSVAPGAPAEQGGLRVGDRILSINGIPLTETARIQRQPREMVGEARSIVVARIDIGSGTTVEEALNITYASELATYPIGLIGGALLGLAFLLCAVVAYLRSPSQQGLLFAIAGLCLAGLLLPDPHVPVYGVRTFLEAVKFLVAFPAFACLLHLTMIFPEPRRMIERKATVVSIYVPACLLGAGGVVQIARGRQMGSVIDLAGMLLLAVYMLLSMTVLILRWATSTRESRAANGLDLLAWGIVLGFGPVAVEVLATLIAPDVSLPGSDYYFLAMVLIPVSFLAALWRWSGRKEGIAVDL